MDSTPISRLESFGLIRFRKYSQEKKTTSSKASHTVFLISRRGDFGHEIRFSHWKDAAIVQNLLIKVCMNPVISRVTAIGRVSWQCEGLNAQLFVSK